MRKLERGGIPGQLSFHITGMAAHGYEPVSLKFFTLDDDGTIALPDAGRDRRARREEGEEEEGRAGSTPTSPRRSRTWS